MLIEHALGNSRLDGTEIRVPASVANLGPGFDTLAVAIKLYLCVKIRRVSPNQQGELNFKFIDHDFKGTNLIGATFEKMAGLDEIHFPSLEIEVRSEIPICAGLGSSAAATVAGLRLYETVAGPQPIERLLRIASEIEGHPDNVSAALLGGLTNSCRTEEGSVLAIATPWPQSLRLIVATPSITVETVSARRVLPTEISRADVVFNLQRVALLLQSLQKQDYKHLGEALCDRLHQPHRLSCVPGLREAIALKHPDLLGVCLSGSGPSVIAFAEKNFKDIETLISSPFTKLNVAHKVRTLNVHQPSSSQCVEK